MTSFHYKIIPTYTKVSTDPHMGNQSLCVGDFFVLFLGFPLNVLALFDEDGVVVRVLVDG